MKRRPRPSLPRKARLLDDRRVIIRALEPGDRPAVDDFFASLSPRSVYMRFLGYKSGLDPSELDQLTHQHPSEHLSLCAVARHDGADTLMGIARYQLDRQSARPCAEFGIVVADRFHGLGAGTVLLQTLCAQAREQGMDCLSGQVLNTNLPMQALLRTFRVETGPGRDPDCYTARILLGPA